MMNFRFWLDVVHFSIFKLLFLSGLIVVLNTQHVAAAETGGGTDSTSNQTSQNSKLSLMTLAPGLTPVSDYRGDIWNRTTLFGDLGGKRQEL